MNMKLNRYDISKIQKLRYKTGKKILELEIKEELPFFAFKIDHPHNLEGENHPVHVLNNLREAILKVQQLSLFNVSIEIDFDESLEKD